MAKAAGLDWAQADSLNEDTLEQRLFGAQKPANSPGGRVTPDFPYLHRELRRKGVTLQLLWEEYLDANPGSHSTVKEHMPVAHRAHLEWTPGRLLNWAASIGPNAAVIVEYQFTHKSHPEMGYRACLGLLSQGAARSRLRSRRRHWLAHA